MKRILEIVWARNPGGSVMPMTYIAYSQLFSDTTVDAAMNRMRAEPYTPEQENYLHTFEAITVPE